MITSWTDGGTVITVLTIRIHRRYAVRSAVQLQREGSGVAQGLLTELSAHGCRVSRVSPCERDLGVGEQVTIVSDLGFELTGAVRWARDGMAGIYLHRAIDPRRMNELLAVTRGVDESGEAGARSAA